MARRCRGWPPAVLELGCVYFYFCPSRAVLGKATPLLGETRPHSGVRGGGVQEGGKFPVVPAVLFSPTQAAAAAGLWLAFAYPTGRTRIKGCSLALAHTPLEELGLGKGDHLVETQHLVLPQAWSAFPKWIPTPPHFTLDFSLWGMLSGDSGAFQGGATGRWTGLGSSWGRYWLRAANPTGRVQAPGGWGRRDECACVPQG